MGNKAKYAALSKNTALFTINSFGSKMISFFMVPLYTYVLSADDFGTADLITSTASLLIPISLSSILTSSILFALLTNHKDATSISSRKISTINKTIFFLFFFAACCGVSGLFEPFLGFWPFPFEPEEGLPAGLGCPPCDGLLGCPAAPPPAPWDGLLDGPVGLGCPPWDGLLGCPVGLGCPPCDGLLGCPVCSPRTGRLI